MTDELVPPPPTKQVSKAQLSTLVIWSSKQCYLISQRVLLYDRLLNVKQGNVLQYSDYFMKFCEELYWYYAVWSVLYGGMYSIRFLSTINEHCRACSLWHCLLSPSIQRNRLYVHRTELTQGRQNLVFVALNFGLCVSRCVSALCKTVLAKCQESSQKMM
jgi:hypothetical protein